MAVVTYKNKPGLVDTVLKFFNNQFTPTSVSLCLPFPEISLKWFGTIVKQVAYTHKVGGSSLGWGLLISTAVFHGFPQTLQTNGRIIPSSIMVLPQKTSGV
jgi:hypothetical protein